MGCCLLRGLLRAGPLGGDPPWSLSSAILQSLLGVRACGVCWGGCGSCLSCPAAERARPRAHPDAPSGGRASPVRSLVALGQHGCPALLGQGHSLYALLLLASASGAEVAVPQGLTPLVTSGESGGCARASPCRAGLPCPSSTGF